jgi:hypothetical protein
MKYAFLVFAVLSSFFLGWTSCRHWKADQGFVKSDTGQEWRMKRMQALGLGDEMVAVYERTR